MAPDPALRLQGVGLQRDARWLLTDVDWSVRPDERWVVLGANGSGKTSLLRIASLYLHPTVGDVEVLGHTLGRVDVRSLRARIGLVSGALTAMLRPDLDALDVVMTAKHAALEPWWHDYDDADRERARELLAFMGCGHAADRAFATLSDGERQRVGLARALMADPDLVLLDEPAAGLDVGGRERLVSRLDALAADRASPPLVFVTHHVEEISASFTHLLVLRAGRVLAQGPLAETLDDDLLSRAFELPLRVERRGDRWAAWAVRARI